MKRWAPCCWRVRRDEHARIVDETRAALGDAWFAGEWALGRSLRRDEAIQSAIEPDDTR